jgi:tRNA-specific 2-thiouridylase
MARNRLIVVQGREHPALHRNDVPLVNTHWIAGAEPAAGNGYGGKTRYRQPDAACVYTPADTANTQPTLHFHDGQWAPTPGQYAVLYRGNVCLGGGVIA